jgi:hypothetical protein
MDVETIHRLVAEGRYEFSKHAEREREADMISTTELFLITVYDPSKRPEHWMDRYKRRRR